MKPRPGVRIVTFIKKPRHLRIEKSRSNISRVTATFKSQVKVVICRVQKLQMLFIKSRIKPGANGCIHLLNLFRC